MVGQQKWLHGGSIHAKSSSVTILVGLGQKVFFDYREESNTQYYHLNFVAAALTHGKLVAGDFYIVDNASVHGGKDTIVLMQQLLHAHGVTLMYLPMYSPELNPCELVFNKIKNWVRNYRLQTTPLWFDVVCAVSTITATNMDSFYTHCVDLCKIKSQCQFFGINK